MSKKTLKKIDLLIIVYAVLLGVGALVFYNLRSFYSVAAGAVISYINWTLSRRLGVRLVMEEFKQRIAILLAVKMLFILGVIVLILSLTPVEPVAFMLGLSVLVFGILSESMWKILHGGDL